MKKLAMLVWLGVALSLAGCGLAEVNARNRAVDQQNRQVYETYRLYMQSQNRQREMSGLVPLPVKSFEEWQQSPGTN
jgi:hypothetical protein